MQNLLISLFKNSSVTFSERSTRRELLFTGARGAAKLLLLTQLAGCAKRLTEAQKAFIAQEKVLELKASGTSPSEDEYSVDVYAALDENNNIIMKDGKEVLEGIMLAPISYDGTVLPRTKHVFDRPITEDELPNMHLAIDGECVKKLKEQAERKKKEEEEEKREEELAKKEGRKPKKKEKKETPEETCEVVRSFVTLSASRKYRDSLPAWQRFKAEREEKIMQTVMQKVAEKLKTDKVSGKPVHTISLSLKDIMNTFEDSGPGGRMFQNAFDSLLRPSVP